MSLEALMWVEKYRPHKIDDLVNQEEVKERLKPLLEKKNELPHLLFAGPPGSGKTTTALVLARELLGELVGDYSLQLNASDERGIDAVRERVKTFASYSDRREGVPFRLVDTRRGRRDDPRRPDSPSPDNGGDLKVHALRPHLQLLFEPHRADPEPMRRSSVSRR